MKNAEGELASALATAVILQLAKCWQIMKTAGRDLTE